MCEEKEYTPSQSPALVERAQYPASGLSGGGKGCQDLIGHTGVYRIADPQAPADAVV